jgi:response regulator RpfG family c-di-GMP phosphodiesterase
VTTKPRILCVDDEPQVLESLRDSLRRRFQVVSTTNGFEALKLLATEDFPVVVSDMRMPLLDGARFVALAREHAPETVRVILSGQSTIQDAVTAVNDGQVFRYLIKPCPNDVMVATLEAGVRHHELMTAAATELSAAVDGAVRGLKRVLRQVEPSADERATRIRQHCADLAATIEDLKGAGDLALAAELSQVGVLALPDEVRRDLARGNPLRDAALTALERIPDEARIALDGIPRLEGARAILAHQTKPFEPTREGYAGTPQAARVLRIVLDYELAVGPNVPPAQALELVRRREKRHDPVLLDRFADLLGLT